MAKFEVAEHTSAQKRFIVLRLAAFDTPRVICDAFRMRFPDTACTEDDVNACHPRVALLPPASRREEAAVLEANAAKLVAALKE